MDHLTVTERTRNMRAIKSKDTIPEMEVRRLLHGMGYRYRLHVKDLPGRPDLVFASRRSVLFVNGCFWHGHSCKRGSRVPKTNRSYWSKKITNNRRRDMVNKEDLERDGWGVLIVWECEIRNLSKLAKRIEAFLDPPPKSTVQPT